ELLQEEFVFGRSQLPRREVAATETLAQPLTELLLHLRKLRIQVGDYLHAGLRIVLEDGRQSGSDLLAPSLGGLFVDHRQVPRRDEIGLNHAVLDSYIRRELLIARNQGENGRRDEHARSRSGARRKSRLLPLKEAQGRATEFLNRLPDF